VTSGLLAAECPAEALLVSFLHVITGSLTAGSEYSVTSSMKVARSAVHEVHLAVDRDSDPGAVPVLQSDEPTVLPLEALEAWRPEVVELQAERIYREVNLRCAVYVTAERSGDRC